MGKKTGAKKGAKRAQRVKNPLFEKNPRSFRVGGDLQPKRDLTRFVRWPKYILLQRQKRVLLSRLKVPPAINQFRHTLDKNQQTQLFKLLNKYQPETEKEKKQRLTEAAQNKATDKKPKDGKKPYALKFGLNHITTLIENKQAKLVIIAADVDPIELIIWLPRLCKKMEVPYAFVKSKARLGQLVHLKTATAVALTDVRSEDKQALELLQKNYRAQYLDNQDLEKKWGGGAIGIKSTHQRELKQAALEKEALKKAKL